MTVLVVKNWLFKEIPMDGLVSVCAVMTQISRGILYMYIIVRNGYVTNQVVIFIMSD